MPLLPGAEPYSSDGGRVGVLVLHGFCGSPWSMRPWAEHLAAQGYTVDLPRLPGHGTHWRELNLTRWPDWYAEADRSFAALREKCDHVFVAGLSVGGCLGLRLAQEHGDQVSGLVLVNPAVLVQDWRLKTLLPWLRFLVPSFPGIVNDIKKAGADERGYQRLPLQAAYSLQQLWDITRHRLPEVTAPVLLMHSPEDHLIPVASSEAVLAGVSSTDVTEVLLHDSYHVACLDNDAPLIEKLSVEFIDRVAT